MFTPGSWACGYRTASGLGNWLSRDPIGERASINLYSFLQNDAIYNSDKDGREGQVADKINCIGHACDNGQLLKPREESLGGIFNRRGFKCRKISGFTWSPTDCKISCNEECGFVLYVYYHKARNWENLSEPEKQQRIQDAKQQFDSGDALNDKGFFEKNASLDYHGIRRNCNLPANSPAAWDWVEQQKFKSKDKARVPANAPYDIDGSAKDPEEFWNPDPKDHANDRIFARYCCTKPKTR